MNNYKEKTPLLGKIWKSMRMNMNRKPVAAKTCLKQ